MDRDVVIQLGSQAYAHRLSLYAADPRVKLFTNMSNSDTGDNTDKCAIADSVHHRAVGAPVAAGVGGGGGGGEGGGRGQGKAEERNGFKRPLWWSVEELGPRTEHSGPCLVLLRGCRLPCAELVHIVESTFLRRYVHRIYWCTHESPSLAAAVQDITTRLLPPLVNAAALAAAAAALAAAAAAPAADAAAAADDDPAVAAAAPAADAAAAAVELRPAAANDAAAACKQTLAASANQLLQARDCRGRGLAGQQDGRQSGEPSSAAPPAFVAWGVGGKDAGRRRTEEHGMGDDETVKSLTKLNEEEAPQGLQDVCFRIQTFPRSLEPWVTERIPLSVHLDPRRFSHTLNVVVAASALAVRSDSPPPSPCPPSVAPESTAAAEQLAAVPAHQQGGTTARSENTATCCAGAAVEVSASGKRVISGEREDKCWCEGERNACVMRTVRRGEGAAPGEAQQAIESSGVRSTSEVECAVAHVCPSLEEEVSEALATETAAQAPTPGPSPPPAPAATAAAATAAAGEGTRGATSSSDGAAAAILPTTLVHRRVNYSRLGTDERERRRIGQRPVQWREVVLYGVVCAWDMWRLPCDREAVALGCASKAVCKLEEALQVLSWRLHPRMAVVDVGAAPGAWTEYVSGKAGRVLAVDPAPLSPHVLRLHNVSHVQSKVECAEAEVAAWLEAGGQHGFDMVLCDANKHPVQSARLIAPLLPFLVPGGLIVMTMKCRGRGRSKDNLMEEVKGLLQGCSMEREQCLWLMANSIYERTFVAFKRPLPPPAPL